MASEVQSQISKRSGIALGGNLAVDGKSGGGIASIVFRHQISSASSVEFMGSVGLRALIGFQTSRYESSFLLYFSSLTFYLVWIHLFLLLSSVSYPSTLLLLWVLPCH